MNYRRIKALVLKEFLALWLDEKTRIIVFVSPLIQLLIFSFAITLEINDISLAIINHDKGKHSYNIIQKFVGSPKFKNLIFVDNEKSAEKAINNQEVDAVIVFQNDFSKKVYSRSNAAIQILLDSRQSNAAQIINSYISQIVYSYNKEIIIKQNRALPLAEIIPLYWFNPTLEPLWNTIPSIICIIVMIATLLITALSVAREREDGTFNQLIVSPLTPLEILIGKTIPATIIGICEGTVAILLAIFLFQIPFKGSILLTYLSLSVFVLSVIGIGLFLSSISKTQQQAILGIIVFMVPASLLSGFASPVDNMPALLQPIAGINPLTHIIVIMKGLFLKDISVGVVLNSLWPLLVLTAITLPTAAWFFKSKLE